MDAQETSLFTAILIVSIILGIIIFYFIYSIVMQQRKNMQLYRQNILAEITALEKERARIASDLHDELGPMLAAVKLKINSFELIYDDDKVQVEKTNEYIDELISRIREISYDLLPNTLIRKGLVLAIREFITFIEKSSSIKFSLHLPESVPLSEQKSIHIYRIVQEIVHNTIKHSEASELKIRIDKTNTHLILFASDNGKGFDPLATTKGSRGIGLKNLLSRTEMIGGVMYVDSQLGKGTNFSFEIPLEQ